MPFAVISADMSCPAETRAGLELERHASQFDESILLRTCHRAEIYVSAQLPSLVALNERLEKEAARPLSLLLDADAVEHLFRVASGLESLVIGEAQILSQVRRAYRGARISGTVGPVLAGVFDRAIFLGRRARSRTSLGRLGHSIGSIAGMKLAEVFGGLYRRRGAIIGAGEAARDAARHLADAGAHLAVLNRTRQHAVELARTLGGASYPLEEMEAVLSRIDFAVVAVSGTRVRIDATGPLVVVDLSSPRAVAPSFGATVIGLEDLSPSRGPEVRRAIFEAEALISEELARFESRRKTA